MIRSKLEDLCLKITDGKHGDCRDEVDSDFYFLSAKDIRNGKIFFENGRKITKEDFLSTDKRTKFGVNDILITNTGASIGRFAIARDDARIRYTTFQKSVSLLKPNVELIYPFYLYYYLCNNKNEIINLGGGSAQANLLLKDIRAYILELPNLIIQKKIAGVLSAYDDLIENNTQRIKLLEEMSEEIYKEWFVRFRFPGYKDAKFFDKDGKEVVRGTVGALPEGWQNVKISEYGKVVTGKTPSKVEESNFNGEIPFIKTPDMQQGMFFNKSEETLSKYGADSQSSQYIPKNSLSVSCIGTVGKIGITTQLSQTNQQINTLIPNVDSSLEFLYFSLLRLKPIIESYAATGATMANLSKSKFENLKMLMVTNKLSNKFHDLVSPFFEEIKVLMQKNQVLQETRDLLLPRLISGKLSVEELDIDEENLNIAAEPAVNYNI